MARHAPHVVIVGATNMDRVRLHPNLDSIEDGKFRAEHSYSAVGGGGANVAIALKQLANVMNMPLHVTFFTKIGREHQDYNLRHEVYQGLESVGIDTRDLAANQDFRLDDNTVISFAGGRFVSLSEKFGKLSMGKGPLDHMLPPQVKPYDPGVEEQVIDSVRSADLVIVTHHFPEISEAAALAAHESGIPVLMDYPVTKYDEAWKYQKTLEACNFILAPAEARLPDMINGAYKNGEGIFSRLTARYPEAFIAVSDGTEPVMTYNQGSKGQIPVMKFPVVDQLGTGDARTAAFALFVLKGNDPEIALKRASRIASFSVQEPGRAWIGHAKDFMTGQHIFTDPAANDQDDDPAPGVSENHYG